MPVGTGLEPHTSQARHHGFPLFVAFSCQIGKRGPSLCQKKNRFLVVCGSPSPLWPSVTPDVGVRPGQQKLRPPQLGCVRLHVLGVVTPSCCRCCHPGPVTRCLWGCWAGCSKWKVKVVQRGSPGGQEEGYGQPRHLRPLSQRGAAQREGGCWPRQILAFLMCPGGWPPGRAAGRPRACGTCFFLP